MGLTVMSYVGGCDGMYMIVDWVLCIGCRLSFFFFLLLFCFFFFKQKTAYEILA